MGPISRPRAQLALYATVFVDLLGFTLVLPTLPFRVTALGGNALWLGVVLTSYSLCQAVAAPVLGRLADRHGRRPLLLLSLAGSAATLALMGAAGSVWLLLAARTLAGLCGGSIGVAQAFAADLAGPEGRTKALGRVGAAVGLAFTLGPALGSLSAPLGFPATAYLGAGLAAANLAFAAATLPAGRAGRPRRLRRPRSDRHGAPRPLLVAGFATMAAFVGMETTVAYLAADRFGAGPVFVGALLAGAGLVLTVVQGFLVAPAVRRVGETGLATVGSILMAAGLLAMPFLPEVPFVAAVLVVSAGNGVVTVATAGLLAAAGPADEIGARMGQGQSATSAARASGPLVAGALFDLAAGGPYLLGATLSAGVALLLGARAPSNTPTTHEEAR